MGKKEVTTTTTRTVVVCDRCHKEVGGYNLNRCEICTREVGYCCGRLLFAHHSGHPGFRDLSFRVCVDCQEAGKEIVGEPYIDTIRTAVRQCDERIEAVLGLWKAWAKERAAGKAGD